MLFKISESSPSQITTDKHTSNDIRFFERISNHLGQDLIYLNSQDHYIKATTSIGSELILMRLADAIAELEQYAGISPHRSWWVSKTHISAIKTVSGKKMIELSNGELVPNSRSNLKQVSDFVDIN